ncbi:MAG: ABC transporter substrate-binding protein, partial [Pseudomonadota bacterium]|nr:ABC transporter substrate-binding protein [Pseudomonadota bacterium]
MQKMTATFSRWFALALLLMALPALAKAQSQSPEQMIRDNIEGFMAQIEGREDYYANNLDELKALVNDSLDDIADFR